MARFGTFKFGEQPFNGTDIETALYETLSANSQVARLVGSRIYPLVAPQDVAMPYLVYERLTSEAEYTHDGPSDLHMARLRLTCGGGLYADCNAVIARIMAALGAPDSVQAGSLKSCGVFFDNPDDAYYLDANVFQRTVELDVQFKLIS